jgi:hypothetical protein
MSSMTDKIPKKKSQAVKHDKPSAKSCALCKKYGGVHTSHNKNDCKKYDHQGDLKKGFKGNKETLSCANKSYAQLFAEMEKLKASHKKLKKALKKSAKKFAVTVTAATLTPNEGVGRVATGS